MADSTVTIENVSLKYKKTVLTNVTINAQKGDVIGLLGLNGSGKSTLLSAISG
ncbi:ATP-binding cassette domain-containing protein, partial [Acinetobacter baumannii]